MNRTLKNYIFLSREIPLPLSALKIINERISFDDIMEFSPSKFRSLIENLNKFEKVNIRNIDKKVSNFKKKNDKKTIDRIHQIIQECERNNIKCLSYFDNYFPEVLKEIKQPPKLVFIKGEIRKSDLKSVAIIGTRKPTFYGEKMAIEITKRLVERDFTIVSGFARGIDTIAIRSAINNGGRAIGVLPSGILNMYPSENKELSKRVMENGALISERFPDKPVTVRALQLRNRITSGFGLANIFVEGTKSSGTKWQFKFGKQQGKLPVGVKPLNLNYEQAYIPNWIINDQGGLIISSLEDVDKLAELLEEKYRDRIDPKDDGRNLTQTTIFKY